MTKPSDHTQFDLDRQGEYLRDMLRPHMDALRRKRASLRRRHLDRAGHEPALEIVVPAEWDLLGLGRVGKCFGLPVYAGSVPKPILRASVTEAAREGERTELLEERLRQRSDAVTRLSTENERLRKALLAVLELTDLERHDAVLCTDVHDAIGGQLVVELLMPGPFRRFEVGMSSLVEHAEKLAEFHRAPWEQAFRLMSTGPTPAEIAEDHPALARPAAQPDSIVWPRYTDPEIQGAARTLPAILDGPWRGGRA